MSDPQADLDIRWPIGLLFLAIGALVAAYGFFSSDPDHLRALGFNLNLWWGLVMLAFGLWMTCGAYLSFRRNR